MQSFGVLLLPSLGDCVDNSPKMCQGNVTSLLQGFVSSLFLFLCVHMLIKHD